MKIPSQTKLNILAGIAAIITSLAITPMLIHLINTTQANAVQQYKDQLTETRRICLESNKVYDGRLERMCGEMLDMTETEFMCDVMGRCWLEWHGYPYYPPKAPTAHYMDS